MGTKCLKNISSLTKLYINHNSITHEAADNIAVAISSNINLQELDSNNVNLPTPSTVKIAAGISSLTKLYINNNNVTEAADDIGAANIYLQELNFGSNNLQASGTTKLQEVCKKFH